MGGSGRAVGLAAIFLVVLLVPPQSAGPLQNDGGTSMDAGGFARLAMPVSTRVIEGSLSGVEDAADYYRIYLRGGFAYWFNATGEIGLSGALLRPIENGFDWVGMWGGYYSTHPLLVPEDTEIVILVERDARGEFPMSGRYSIAITQSAQLHFHHLLNESPVGLVEVTLEEEGQVFYSLTTTGFENRQMNKSRMRLVLSEDNLSPPGEPSVASGGAGGAFTGGLGDRISGTSDAEQEQQVIFLPDPAISPPVRADAGLWFGSYPDVRAYDWQRLGRIGVFGNYNYEPVRGSLRLAVIDIGQHRDYITVASTAPLRAGSISTADDVVMWWPDKGVAAPGVELPYQDQLVAELNDRFFGMFWKTSSQTADVVAPDGSTSSPVLALNLLHPPPGNWEFYLARPDLKVGERPSLHLLGSYLPAIGVYEGPEWRPLGT